MKYCINPNLDKFKVIPIEFSIKDSIRTIHGYKYPNIYKYKIWSPKTIFQFKKSFVDDKGKIFITDGWCCGINFEYKDQIKKIGNNFIYPNVNSLGKVCIDTILHDSYGMFNNLNELKQWAVNMHFNSTTITSDKHLVELQRLTIEKNYQHIFDIITK